MIIDENFLKKDFQEEIYDLLVGNNFPWFYYKTTMSGLPEYNLEDYRDVPFFTHMLFLNERINSPFFYQIKKVFDEFAEKHKIQYESFLQVRANFMLKQTDPRPLPPHVDFTFDHNVFLYYVNSSDGDTVFLKKDKKSVTKKISPKMGKSVLFDGSTFHSIEPPMKNENRLVLNFSFI
jgi:hypothetical protein